MSENLILSGIPLNGKTYVAGMEDELAANLTKEQIAYLTEQGALSGFDTKADSKAEFPEDYPGFEVLGQVEGMTRAKLEAMPDEEILKIKGIGPATLKEIRDYK